jgi:hypothetical protein
MTNEEQPELERLDPESEACFEALAARIAEELSARIAVGDDPSTPKGCGELSELVADAVLDGFVVRKRTTPRYRWVRATS